jgi:hypothetical protein
VAQAGGQQVVSAQTNQIFEVAGGGLRCLVSDAGSVSMTTGNPDFFHSVL